MAKWTTAWLTSLPFSGRDTCATVPENAAVASHFISANEDNHPRYAASALSIGYGVLRHTALSVAFFDSGAAKVKKNGVAILHDTIEGRAAVLLHVCMS